MSVVPNDGAAIEFEHRAVAFIDVLGFKAIVNRATEGGEGLVQLSSLIKLLSETVPTLDDSVDESIASNLIPRHTYISDCIIVRAPLTDKNRTTYDGLSVVVMWVIQLAHYFLRAGYLVHGGIAVGKVSHTSVNVIGPAYQEAYQLEQRCND